jgi:hypothetical protein
LCWLLLGLALWAAGPATAADTPCQGEPLERLNDCLMDELAGFGGVSLQECDWVVYVTDAAQRPRIRAVMDTLRRQPALRLDWCPGNRGELVLRDGDYAYRALRAWFERLYYPIYYKAPGSGVDLPEHNRLIAHARTPHARQRLLRLVDQFGIPREALSFGLPGAASVLPELADGQLTIAAVRVDGSRAGQLVLGRTRMDRALKLLPAAFGHGPRRPSGQRSPWLSAELQRFLDDLRYAYNPKLTELILGFDRDKRLRMVQQIVPSGQSAELYQWLAERAALQPVHTDRQTRVERGRLGGCVTVELVSNLVDDQPLTRAVPEDWQACTRQLRDGTPAAAIACLNEAVAEEPDLPVTQYLLGVAQLRAGNRDATLRQLGILRDLYPANAGALLDEISALRPDWLNPAQAERLRPPPEAYLASVAYFHTCEPVAD